MTARHRINVEEIEAALSSRLCPLLRHRVATSDLAYDVLSPAERDAYLIEVADELVKPNVVKAGPHRQADWETGWGENLALLQHGTPAEAIVPRYHGKRSLVRWRQEVVRPLDPLFDYRIHTIIVDWAIDTFLKDVGSLYEFGCGPAYHLLRARQFNPAAKLVGLDWATASQKIIGEIASRGIETNMQGFNFDFFKPDYSIKMPPGSGIYTVAALEQVGADFEPFLQFLLEKRPAVCVHLEPIDELMDSSNLIDRLSVLYSRKRNYLNGFLPRLRRLQEEGVVKIHKEQRTYSGSFFLEGHSLVVWSPK
jgi:hypothetical protein